jgi:hypothetical protein
MAGHQRTADTPAGGGRADTPAGGGQGGAILRMGIRACAMGEGRIRREPRRGGREDKEAYAGPTQTFVRPDTRAQEMWVKWEMNFDQPRFAVAPPTPSPVN